MLNFSVRAKEKNVFFVVVFFENFSSSKGGRKFENHWMY